MAHLANNFVGGLAECTNKVLRTAWEMYVRLFQTPLLLKNEKSINNQSKREQKPQNCYGIPQKEVGIPQKEVLIFNL